MNGLFNRIVIGLMLVAVGLLFMLNQIGLITHFDYGYIFSTYWPVFIIYFGLAGMFSRRKHEWGGSYVWNVFTILVGCFFLLRNLEVEGFTFENISKFIVPVAIILVGVSMMFRSPGRRRRMDEWGDVPPPPPPPPPPPAPPRASFDHPMTPHTVGDPAAESVPPFGPDDANLKEGGTPLEHIHVTDHHHRWEHRHHRMARDGVLNRSNFIGDIHLGQDYWQLTPVEVSHFIGDTVIDLTTASIPYGETKIEVSSFIGDVKLYVPNDFDVELAVESNVFIGDIKVLDRREGGLFKHMTLETPGYRDAGKKIRIVANMFIGDVKVQKVG
jgi:lia operon protein LiaF